MIIIGSIHVQSVCDSLDIPHFEMQPVLKNQFYNFIQKDKLERRQVRQPTVPINDSKKDTKLSNFHKQTQTMKTLNNEDGGMVIEKEKQRLLKLPSYNNEKKNVLNKNIFQNKRSVYISGAPSKTFKAHLSLNVHPRVEDLNIAYRDFIVRANWTKVALLYSGENSGTSTLHLQHLLLLEYVECLTKKLLLHDTHHVLICAKLSFCHFLLL